MYTALYRTERPETFDEILGQEHIVKILKNQVATGTVGHAYLFAGTRGTGKTSTARILAKAVNCTGEGDKPCGVCPSCRAIKEGSFIDMIEIDAASNNGVDNVRELRESVNYPPAVGKKKVYIIDEAHMLTPQALNALLKTLEEPPENVMFILATTDPQRLLQTILSRCLRLDFRRIPDIKIADHMKKICDARGIAITQDALRLLASNADGSVRDGLSLLDQCLSGGGNSLDRDTVLEYLGTVADDFFIRLTGEVLSSNAAGGIVMLDEILRDGKDVKLLVSDWLSHYRSLLVSKYVENPETILNMSTENVAKLVGQSRSMDIHDIERGIMLLSKTVNDVRYSSQPRILLELAIVMLAGNMPNSGSNQQKNAEKTIISDKSETFDQEKDKNEPVIGSNQAKSAEKTIISDKSEAFDLEKPGEGAVTRSVNTENLSDIWEAVWDRVGSRGSMVMVRLNSYLAGISDTDFKVIFTNRYAMEQAERNAASFIDAMAAETGKTLKMVSTFAEPEEAAQQSFLGEEVPVSQIVDLGSDAEPGSESDVGAGESNAANNTESADDSNGAAESDGNTESDDASEFGSLSDEELEAIARELEADFDVKARIE
ncbi:MAG: DNA polymerase III subunit gamma/tau [Firmicutes bacterium]|nr:DNA polymerase III subunit gamma/tau [Bacillota bacterium]